MTSNKRLRRILSCGFPQYSYLLSLFHTNKYYLADCTPQVEMCVGRQALLGWRRAARALNISFPRNTTSVVSQWIHPSTIKVKAKLSLCLT